MTADSGHCDIFGVSSPIFFRYIGAAMEMKK